MPSKSVATIPANFIDTLPRARWLVYGLGVLLALAVRTC
jgi:hypothetical protein